MKNALFSLALLLAAAGIQAQTSDPAMDIVRKANLAAYYAGSDGKAEVTMTIRDKDGSTRTREFALLRLSEKPAGGQKFYVYFREPADVRKMAYLVHKHVDKPDDRWMWLPALNLARRIAPGDKRSSFVGSDFVYEDVSGRNLDEDVHELIEETADYYRIKSTPKRADEVEFAFFVTQIRKQDYLPVKAEYTDRQGRLYRRVEAIEADIKEISGHPTVLRAIAYDLLRGTSTENTFSAIEYDIGLTDSIFTERYLRRPPREVR